ncbi:DUF4158 domain-containing protein [Pseudaminobacter soli (ex Li et al. 2025)]|uniref:DUF4158 domain-containing protein n=1 Tax=Pseudaminobacter soli (ex Li et al. 2025) TaxID=1295366 RepID=UPI003CD04D76
MELSRWWSLNSDELALIEAKPSRTSLGFAVQLKTYRHAGPFVDHTGEVPSDPPSRRTLAVPPVDL